ncbi:MAG: hypothetical protein HFH58_15415 [Lachnospiraceae bacterium]|nr:hypothetical protein [Lachnospiraceae bacterium]
MADYFDSIKDLIYDNCLELKLRIEHIMDPDNQNHRFNQWF